MAQPRSLASSDVREELIESERRLLDIAKRIDAKAAGTMAQRLHDLERGHAIRGLHGWEVGMPPNSGPWTLTATNELVPEGTRR